MQFFSIHNSETSHRYSNSALALDLLPQPEEPVHFMQFLQQKAPIPRNPLHALKLQRVVSTALASA